MFASVSQSKVYTTIQLKTSTKLSVSVPDTPSAILYSPIPPGCQNSWYPVNREL